MEIELLTYKLQMLLVLRVLLAFGVLKRKENYFVLAILML